MSLKKIHLDGVEYEAEAKVIESLSLTQAKLDSVTKENEANITKYKNDVATITAERDQHKEALEKMKADFAELEKSIPTKLDEAIKTRVQLIEAGKKAGIEIKEDAKNLDIMKAVVLKVFPGSQSKLDTANDTYIQARFDGALEILSEKQTEQTKTDTTLQGDSIANAPEKKDSASTSYRKMVEDRKNAWKNKEAK